MRRGLGFQGRGRGGEGGGPTSLGRTNVFSKLCTPLSRFSNLSCVLIICTTACINFQRSLVVQTRVTVLSERRPCCEVTTFRSQFVSFVPKLGRFVVQGSRARKRLFLRTASVFLSRSVMTRLGFCMSLFFTEIQSRPKARLLLYPCTRHGSHCCDIFFFSPPVYEIMLFVHDVIVTLLLCYCYVIVMSLLCYCYVIVMLLLCYCYVIVMLLLCYCYVIVMYCYVIVTYCYVIVMSLLCYYCYVIVMSLLCHCYVIVMLLLRYCYVIVTLLLCYCYVIVMLLLRYCYVIVMLLLRYCYVIVMLLLCYYYVIVMLLLCYCYVIVMLLY